MEKNLFEIFIKKTFKDCLTSEVKNDLYENLQSMIEEEKDINIYKSSTMDITILGKLTKKLKKMNYNVFLVYKFNETIGRVENEHFGFIYKDKNKYINYSINLSYCFSGMNEFEDPFKCFVIEDSEVVNVASFLYFLRIKNIIGYQFYDILVELMLEETNNKLRNLIHKVF